jgi:glycosyltransferase involved in cell wall biosynthesis
MNILYVSNSPTVSGAENVLLGYIDHLRAPVHQCHVVVPADNSRLASELRRRGATFTATSSYSKVLLETTANPRSLAHFMRSFWNVSREVIGIIRERQIDIIHSISYPASLYAAFPARYARVPQIWHEHNIKQIHWANRHLCRFVAGSCACVIGPSDAVTDNLAKAGIDRKKIRKIHYGIDLSRFSVDRDASAAVRRELGISEAENAVGIFGQLLPYKGHRTLIEAAPAVLEARPSTRFFVVGALENPPYEQELRQALRTSGLESRFVFTGWRSDVQHVIQAMDIVVVATTTPEPAALALHETMAMGRPIVGSQTGGTAEIVRDGMTGFLFPAGDARALADRLVLLLRDCNLRAKMGAAGRQLVEQEFSMELHLRQMELVYEKALHEWQRTEAA